MEMADCDGQGVCTLRVVDDTGRKDSEKSPRPWQENDGLTAFLDADVTDGELAAVSVVIPCYRCSRTIQRAIASVFQQTLKPAEIILVDDASGDETIDVLREIEQQNFDWVNVIALNENSGVASARNAGWAVATQPYIAFLDADDVWHPKKLEIQYAYMLAHPKTVLSGHGHRVLAQTDTLPDWQVETDSRAVQLQAWRLLLSNRFITPSVMLRRDIGQRFAEKQHYMEDHLLWSEIVCAGGEVMKLDAELAAIYKHLFGAAGLSSNIWLMGKNDLSNYQRLYHSGCINVGQWWMLSLYSSLKFMRRLVIYWGYMHWRK